MSVDSAYFDYSFGGAIPRGGYKVLILSVTMTNVTDRNRGYDEANFSGIDATTGVAYKAVTIEDAGVLLHDGDLQPGQYVSGVVLIEVQESAGNVVIKYNADLMGDEDLYWE